MVAPSITLTCTSFTGASTRTVLGQRVRVGLKKNIVTEPPENGTALATVQTQSYDAPRYNIDGVQITGASGTLTYADVLTLLRLKYAAGTAGCAQLTVTYGTASTLVGVDGSTTAIKVVLDSADFPIDVRDSNRGYLPTMTLNFIETA